jgi:hypothetical protein
MKWLRIRNPGFYPFILLTLTKMTSILPKMLDPDPAEMKLGDPQR